MQLGLAGRVAVVTAASKGLGRATAQALAAEGTKLVLNARSADALDELAATIADAVVVPGDITEAALPARLVNAATERWGRVDIVVGNADGPPTGSALEVEDDQILAAVNVNLLASIRLARAAVPHMRHQQWGRVVFIASAFVRQPIRDLALSNIARTGLWAWTKTAAQDLADQGITVNIAAPGPARNRPPHRARRQRTHRQPHRLRPGRRVPVLRASELHQRHRPRRRRRHRHRPALSTRRFGHPLISDALPQGVPRLAALTASTHLPPIGRAELRMLLLALRLHG